MNFRKLITYLTMGTAAAMPLAVAQNPTILQGNYITNVFGNSNFVLNPNALTNVANVTNATRSTTTPLVATSEFTLSLASGANATWTLRAFDGGMKGQNCEARFTYRGFATATTKAEIVQNSLVVASLTLTPTTDPRIASINFPCGDLANLTTFRIAQTTANMTGTNEIGGIYVGLATNMANVAQAEFVGQSGYGYSGDLSFETVSNTYADLISNQTLGAGVVENQGNASSSAPTSGVTPLQTTIANPKPGNYYVTFSGVLRHDNLGVAGNCAFRITPVVNGVMDVGGPDQAVIYTNNTGQTELSIGGNASLSYQLTSTPATLSFKLMGKLTTGGGACRARIENSGSGTGATRMKFTVHRFPLSSELVVTPERQNWYISAYHGGANPLLSTAAVASRTEITNGSLSLTPTVGSQPAATLCSGTNAPPALSTSATTCAAGNESVGLTFNIPSTGIYEVCAAFGTNVEANAASSADTVFSIEETSTTSATNLTTNPSIPRYSSSSTAQTATTYPTTKCQLFNFSSLGQKAVRLMYMQNVTGTVTQNLVIADAVQGRIVQWTVTPVTNQSNSALYVEGPVKASATGAAISAGYVGEEKSASSGGFIAAGTTANWKTVASLQLEAGVWMCSAATTVGCAATNCYDPFPGFSATNNGAGVNLDGEVIGINAFQPGWTYWSNGVYPHIIRSTGTSLVLPNGSTTASNTLYWVTRVTYPSGAPTLNGKIRCVRIN